MSLKTLFKLWFAITHSSGFHLTLLVFTVFKRAAFPQPAVLAACCRALTAPGASSLVFPTARNLPSASCHCVELELEP